MSLQSGDHSPLPEGLSIPVSISELEAMPASYPYSQDMDSRDDRSGSDMPTPTYYQQQHRQMEGDGMPEGHIVDWEPEDVAVFVSSLGLDQYHDAFIGGLSCSRAERG